MRILNMFANLWSQSNTLTFKHCYVYIYIDKNIYYIYVCRHISNNWLWHTEPIKQLPLICKGRYFCAVYPSSGRYVLIVYSHWSQGSRSITIPSFKKWKVTNQDEWFHDPATDGFLDVPLLTWPNKKRLIAVISRPRGDIWNLTKEICNNPCHITEETILLRGT